MKKRLFAALVIALLSLSLLMGCYAEAPNLLRNAEPAVDATLLTESQVRSIVADHAKVPEEALLRFRLELDVDFGIPKYEVEFVNDGWEYDYEIHAQTGAILSWEMDWND